MHLIITSENAAVVFMQGPTFGDQACKPMRWALNRTTSAPAPQRNPAGKILGLTSLGSRDLTVLFLTLSLLRSFEQKYKGGKKTSTTRAESG